MLTCWSYVNFWNVSLSMESQVILDRQFLEKYLYGALIDSASLSDLIPFFFRSGSRWPRLRPLQSSMYGLLKTS